MCSLQRQKQKNFYFQRCPKAGQAAWEEGRWTSPSSTQAQAGCVSGAQVYGAAWTSDSSSSGILRAGAKKSGNQGSTPNFATNCPRDLKQVVSVPWIPLFSSAKLGSWTGVLPRFPLVTYYSVTVTTRD